tara:strand:+ start:225 stop:635 length:411 start_codon:yes stop_codon:yes gene_type:complete
MKKILSMALCMNILLIGCAAGASEISAAYVSPAKYSGYDCDQINLERDSVERRVNELYYAVEQRAKNDKVSMGVGMVLFWPALFFLKGDSPEAAEYARMKGEYEAIQAVAIQKKCDIRFEKELMDTIDASKNNPNN